MDSRKLEAQLVRSFDEFIALFSKFDNQIINDEVQPEKWTVGQLSQHVVLSTNKLFDAKTKKADRPFDKWAKEIENFMMNHTLKMTAPEFNTPEKREYDPAKILSALEENKGAQIKNFNEKDLSEISLNFEIQGMGYLTRYEWLVLMNFHIQRHTLQLRKMYLWSPKVLDL